MNFLVPQIIPFCYKLKVNQKNFFKDLGKYWFWNLFYTNFRFRTILELHKSIPIKTKCVKPVLHLCLCVKNVLKCTIPSNFCFFVIGHASFASFTNKINQESVYLPFQLEPAFH